MLLLVSDNVVTKTCDTFIWDATTLKLFKLNCLAIYLIDHMVNVKTKRILALFLELAFY